MVSHSSCIQCWFLDAFPSEKKVGPLPIVSRAITPFIGVITPVTQLLEDRNRWSKGSLPGVWAPKSSKTIHQAMNVSRYLDV